MCMCVCVCFGERCVGLLCVCVCVCVCVLEDACFKVLPDVLGNGEERAAGAWRSSLVFERVVSFLCRDGKWTTEKNKVSVDGPIGVRGCWGFLFITHQTLRMCWGILACVPQVGPFLRAPQHCAISNSGMPHKTTTNNTRTQKEVVKKIKHNTIRGIAGAKEWRLSVVRSTLPAMHLTPKAVSQHQPNHPKDGRAQRVERADWTQNSQP